jgi:uncharacterized protein
MGKLILLGIAVIVAIWLLRRALAKPRAEVPPSGTQGDLVSCAHCGVNLPKAEARSDGGPQLPRYYCSEEHWRAGPREG